ncbi:MULTISPECIES: tryptophan 7-halogenase [unclassified Microbulbifer]|uniref:tryptophan halogenase family protein n=1 Tax=unclassified Microbulbifer TaxID=2619833 RepID=UPI0027E40C4F|nr:MULTISPECIES: tryptophan 7-halogenase [unclassified Microbulbifer]
MDKNNNSGQIRRVLVVGGGTAGWLAAAHLARKLASRSPDGVKVTLVESENIPTIGVGEGTVPAIRQTLHYLGISETEFVRECDATFKQGIKFVDWVRPPGTPGPAYYHHIFDYPDQKSADLIPAWLLQGRERPVFTDAVSVQGRVCDLGLGPKLVTHAEYAGVVNYAYHLDAAKFARLLARHAVENLGVEHLLAQVQQVKLGDDGAIESLVTDRFGELRADLFVDCTGFSSLLLGQALGVRFIDKRDVLFADYALAAQAPYPSVDALIPSYTIASAREAGWIWDIGLSARRGAGYVYSSDHTSHERAEQVLRDYLGPQAEGVQYRRIPMCVGYREKFWHKNCVAIGLSQGFVEPLEATGLLVYDATARMLAETFPTSVQSMELVAGNFNRRAGSAWDSVIDFIKLHYCLSQRMDNPFWLENREGLPDSLREKLELWRYQPPTEYDFPSKAEVFNLANYLYVLYGMEFHTEVQHARARYGDISQAERQFSRNSGLADEICSGLIPHRALIEKIKQYGLQKV